MACATDRAGYSSSGSAQKDSVIRLFTFATPTFTTVTVRSRAESPRIPAVAYCQGTLLRNEIEARGSEQLAEATDIAAEAIAKRFGRGAIDGKLQAHVIAVENQGKR